MAYFVYVSKKEIVAIHDAIVEATGGSLGLREPGMLAAVAEKPMAGFGDHDLYPSLYDKAAALFEAICNYHVFVDGNKRTAIAVLEYFLNRNGYSLDATKDEKEKFTLSIATSNPDLADVAKWIEKHSKKAKK